jgi:hypothetical protein
VDRIETHLKIPHETHFYILTIKKQQRCETLGQDFKTNLDSLFTQLSHHWMVYNPHNSKHVPQSEGYKGPFITTLQIMCKKKSPNSPQVSV